MHRLWHRFWRWFHRARARTWLRQLDNVRCRPHATAAFVKHWEKKIREELDKAASHG